MIDRLLRGHAEPDGKTDDMIQMPLLHKRVSHDVICHKSEVIIQTMLVDEVYHLALQHLLLKLNIHPLEEALLQLLNIMLCVIAVDA